MPDPRDPPAGALDREGRIFARYLAGAVPSAYALGAYERGHASIPFRHTGPPDAVDRMLLRFARLGTVATRLADGYARFFRPTGVLRQKLVLMCAVLENSPETHVWFNSAAVGSGATIFARLLLAGVVAAINLSGALLLLGPLHLVAGLRDRIAGRGNSP
jgi:hypothetical protein